MAKLLYEFWHIPKSIQKLKNLTAGEKTVLSYLFTINNCSQSRKLQPKRETIAEEMGISTSTVDRAIAGLEKKNFLIIKGQWELNTNRINNYIISFK